MFQLLKAFFVAKSSASARHKGPRCGHRSVSEGLDVGCVECAQAFQRARDEVRRAARENGN